MSSLNTLDPDNLAGIGIANYPFGVVYSTKSHQEDSKYFKQFVPMKGVPKLIDLTKENISD